MDLERIRAAQGDKKALAGLLKDHYSFLFKYAWKMCGEEQLAYDITQETIMKAIRKLHQYKGNASFSTWLLQIATHTFLDMKKKHKNTRFLHEHEINHIEAAKVPEEWFETQTAIWKLEEKHRIPILLKHYYGYEYEEIANLLKLKTGTVKSRVHYGLDRLRKELNIDE
ncbi:UNVERIFIED_CONTAM: sigma-70 family RNA polymerase sigma factor [Halobacillus marinus]|uniref:sigma-70 family RNA polymerase sigma factor n=1 Tax=Halobacillus sp. BAB-2008 TaxID=1246484 RepID=UPI0002A4CF39|nr:sigma-70 family RNA polymerase sigma factor [Halobacillus sp. BAB-2008]ELK48855.1 RNA polymerase sigma factor SigY [Halobacillus sp. BAB-2008]